MKDIHRENTLAILRVLLDNAKSEFSHANAEYLDKAYQSANDRNLDGLGTMLWKACSEEAEFATDEIMESIETQEKNDKAENDLLNTMRNIALQR